MEKLHTRVTPRRRNHAAILLLLAIVLQCMLPWHLFSDASTSPRTVRCGWIIDPNLRAFRVVHHQVSSLVTHEDNPLGFSAQLLCRADHGHHTNLFKNVNGELNEKVRMHSLRVGLRSGHR